MNNLKYINQEVQSMKKIIIIYISLTDKQKRRAAADSDFRNQRLSCRWVSLASHPPPPLPSQRVPGKARSSAAGEGPLQSSRCNTEALPDG